MATMGFDPSAFRLVDCRTCARAVLTWLDLDAQDEPLYRCVHCDSVAHNNRRPVGADDLAAHGYGIRTARTCGNGGGCASRACCTREAL